jgi:hypothetical protein
MTPSWVVVGVPADDITRVAAWALRDDGRRDSDKSEARHLVMPLATS